MRSHFEEFDVTSAPLDRHNRFLPPCGEGVSFSTLIWFPAALRTIHEQQETQINSSLSAETLITKLISTSICESDLSTQTLSCGHRAFFTQREPFQVSLKAARCVVATAHSARRNMIKDVLLTLIRATRFTHCFSGFMRRYHNKYV